MSKVRISSVRETFLGLDAVPIALRSLTPPGTADVTYGRYPSGYVIIRCIFPGNRTAFWHARAIQTAKRFGATISSSSAEVIRRDETMDEEVLIELTLER